MNEVYEFLKSAGTYYLATVEGDQPWVRAFGAVFIFEGKLYIQTGKSKDVSKQIQANPKAEICAFKDGVWLRVAGQLIRDDRKEAKSHMLSNYPELQAMYSADDVFWVNQLITGVSAGGILLAAFMRVAAYLISLQLIKFI